MDPLPISPRVIALRTIQRQLDEISVRLRTIADDLNAEACSDWESLDPPRVRQRAQAIADERQREERAAEREAKRIERESKQHMKRVEREMWVKHGMGCPETGQDQTRLHNDRISAIEALKLLKMGWQIVEEEGRAAIFLPAGSKAVSLGQSAMKVLKNDGVLERLPAEEGDPEGHARFVLSPPN